MPKQNMCLRYIISQLLCEKYNIVIISFVQNLLCVQSAEFMNIKADGAVSRNNGNL
jgi:hypothetical protein